MFSIVVASKSAPSLSIGLGMNLSTISGSDSIVTGSFPRPGLNVKLGFEQNFSKHFSLVSGISLESKGEENHSLNIVDPTFSEEKAENAKIVSLQLPALAQFNIPFNIFSVNIFAGPELGVFLSGEKEIIRTSRFTDTDGERSAVDTTKIDFSKNMKMLDCGFNFGLGIEIKTGDLGAFFIKPGVYFGLTDIIEKSIGNDTTSNLSGKHNVIYCTVGYKFNAKIKKSKTDSDAESTSGSTTNNGSQVQDNIEQYRKYNSVNSTSSPTENEGHQSESWGNESETDSDNSSEPTDE
jgi:hypothetical protein